MAQLSRAEQYAAVELFRGTMVRHNVVVYQDDSPGGSQRMSFTGDAWRDFVPIRMPDTICVQERLPPGAAAVVINRSHTYTDLYLPIDATEKRLLDAVDGSRTIAEIAGGNATQPDAGSRLERARAFFERLWWYDQVVFDASHSAEKITPSTPGVTDRSHT